MNATMQIAGWTLIHFVWQGAAIAVMAAVALRLTERRSSNVAVPCRMRRPRRDACRADRDRPTTLCRRHCHDKSSGCPDTPGRGPREHGGS